TARGSSLSRSPTLSRSGPSPLPSRQPKATADHRSTVCHSAPPRSHSHWPTNQDAAADQFSARREPSGTTTPILTTIKGDDFPH
uniref:Uncharacterized protein n=1 Tax=Caenorhabditis japonica TaxID=281687 RepID=A0A8R1ID45_CAEJA